MGGKGEEKEVDIDPEEKERWHETVISIFKKTHRRIREKKKERRMKESAREEGRERREIKWGPFNPKLI